MAPLQFLFYWKLDVGNAIVCAADARNILIITLMPTGSSFYLTHSPSLTVSGSRMRLSGSLFLAKRQMRCDIVNFQCTGANTAHFLQFCVAWLAVIAIAMETLIVDLPAAPAKEKHLSTQKTGRRERKNLHSALYLTFCLFLFAIRGR